MWYMGRDKRAEQTHRESVDTWLHEGNVKVNTQLRYLKDKLRMQEYQ